VSVLVACLVAAAVFTGVRALSGRRGVAHLERRIAGHLVPESQPARWEPAATRGGRLVDAIERPLARRAWWRAFEDRVERAGITREPVAVGAVVAAGSVVLGLVGLAAGGALLGLIGLAAAPLLAWWGLGALARRRLRLFEAQLPDLLSALGGSLRAGHGFLQSLQTIAVDTPKPAGEELRRALREARLGRPVEDALAGIGRRIPSKDFAYVLTAITVQRQVGGSLAGLFDTVNETVRQRQQFARKVRALTATGRTSSHALIALPIGMALLLTAFNHSYLVPLFTSHAGRLMLFGSALLMVIGIVLVRRVVSFRG
jgi:tight adherence protein B